MTSVVATGHPYRAGITASTAASITAPSLPHVRDIPGIHGARAVLRSAKVAAKKQHPLDRTRAWALALSERIGHNKAAVALANKQARRLWAAEHHRKNFDPDHLSVRATPTTN